jgi:hypothetical protein
MKSKTLIFSSWALTIGFLYKVLAFLIAFESFLISSTKLQILSKFLPKYRAASIQEPHLVIIGFGGNFKFVICFYFAPRRGDFIRIFFIDEMNSFASLLSFLIVLQTLCNAWDKQVMWCKLWNFFKMLHCFNHWFSHIWRNK